MGGWLVWVGLGWLGANLLAIFIGWRLYCVRWLRDPEGHQRLLDDEAELHALREQGEVR